jgi:hypothetical protein
MAVLTDPPLWMQGDGDEETPSVSYSARQDRQLIASIFTEGILGDGSFAVSQRSAGANFSVDVAAGVAASPGPRTTRTSRRGRPPRAAQATTLRSLRVTLTCR